MQLLSLSQLNYMYLCSSHLVTSSTWCAQALFLKMGASPCQMTRICWGQNFCQITRVCWVRKLLDNQDMLRTKNYKIPTGFEFFLKWFNFCKYLKEDPLFGLLACPPPPVRTGSCYCENWSPGCQGLPGRIRSCFLMLSFMSFDWISPPPHTSSSSSTSRVLLIPESA